MLDDLTARVARQMKAVLFDRAGEPEHVLRLGDLPKPEAGSDELPVRVVASPIHPADLSFIRGLYRIRPTFDRWLSARTPDELSRIVASLWSLVRQDALPLPVDSTFALSDFGQALAADARLTRRGKILLAIDAATAGEITSRMGRIAHS